jgi:hypothetical protein
LRMRSISATEVPPNFITNRDITACVPLGWNVGVRSNEPPLKKGAYT